ncbi:hypothetical protein L1277_001645 [Okibacterium sp. HSC-33S16]|uniref:hypothetical protein n=1 Tax=Okibacterium sp. HSC-33S16 TaxID=2910965 RepID=UPI00209F0988|nr:hypothetical protein [Okibacterium sp. HSC-33S16]MCP2031554.1 hypothetical protein [Okibacterium sp. HSC-33S16]
MYLRDLISSLGRRWYLVLVGLIATGGLAMLAYNTVPVSYDARASMVLLPPATSVTEGGNPYLYLSGLGQALDILARRIDSDVVRAPIEGSDTSKSYTVAPDATTSGPILAIESSAGTEDAALDMIDEVVDAVPLALSSLQTELDVPEYSRITAMTITMDTEATLNEKTRLQATLALIGVGFAATILLTGFIDGRLMARRARLAATPEPSNRAGQKRRKASSAPSIADELDASLEPSDDPDLDRRESADRDELLAPRR